MSERNNYFGLITQRAMIDASSYSLKEALKYVSEDFIKRDTGKELEGLLNSCGVGRSELEERFSKVLVKRWLDGLPISRDKAFEVCLFLELSLDKAEVFVKKVCEENWVHLREYKDIIYFFLLYNGKSLKECGEITDSVETARQLIDKYKYLDQFNPSVDRSEELGLGTTQWCKEQVYSCFSLQELEDFLRTNEQFFGSFNQTAYRHFKDAADYWLLSTHDTDASNALELDDQAGMNTLTALSDEIRSYIYLSRSNKGLSEVQASFSAGAPNRQGITDSYNKRKNVTRRQLLLVNVLIAGYIDQTFEEAVNSLNQTLYECGMPFLDSLNSFDWAILNSLSALSQNDDDADVPIGRWADIMKVLFPDK